MIEAHGPQNVEECPRLFEARGFRTAFIEVRDLLPRVLKNVLSHPMAFLRYERETGFIATATVMRYLRGNRNGVPGADIGTRLLRAWRDPEPRRSSASW